MSSRPWLIIDVSNLCHRAFHGLRDFGEGDVDLAVRYGFYRDLATLYRKAEPCGVLLAFDDPMGKSKRRDIYPAYKSGRAKKRQEEDEEAKAARAELYKTITALAHVGVGRCGVGFSRGMIQSGYEADDLIAVAVGKVERALIVSSDQDLFQLLRPGVRILSPHTKKIMTAQGFKELYGIEPSQWAKVKAVAGCSSDSIAGVKGVGEKTAAKFIAKDLGKHTKAYEAIQASKELCKSNLRLTRLPFDDKAAIIEPDEGPINSQMWDDFMREQEFPSLVGAVALGRSWGKGKKKRRRGLTDA